MREVSQHPSLAADYDPMAMAVVIEEPERLSLRPVTLGEAGDEDVVVDLEWTGISTGTERLLWSGRMPPFPGLGYPLVPGYESVGRVRWAGARSGRSLGDRVFVPGSSCFRDVRGLFGGASARIVVPGARALAVAEDLGEQAVLLALAATACHAVSLAGSDLPDLIVGHGVLGRLLARVVLASGGAPPTVWEVDPLRARGAEGYRVVEPTADPRRDYRSIIDASGDASLVDELIARLAAGGEICLAGFYSEPVRFEFAPAFLREARLRVSAEWQPHDLVRAKALVESGDLRLDDLITHRRGAAEAEGAYRTAFGDPACLKMILDWSSLS